MANVIGSRLGKASAVALIGGVFWWGFYEIFRIIPIPDGPAWAFLTAYGGFMFSMTLFVYLSSPYLLPPLRTDVTAAIARWPIGLMFGWLLVGIGTLPFLSNNVIVAVRLCGIVLVIICFRGLNRSVRSVG